MKRGKSILRNELISRRAFIIGLAKASIFFTLLIRLIYIQLFKRKEYKELSEKNRISLIVTPPIRGNIYDINDKALALNQSCFRLLIDKSINPNYLQEVTKIQQILRLDEEAIELINKKIHSSNRKLPTVMLENLNWEQIASIEECKNILTSVFVDKSQIRFYPFEHSFCHLIGYIGKPEQKNNNNLLFSNSDFNIGKTGIEKFYEEFLKGIPGYKHMEVNAYGKYIQTLAKTESSQGENLYLNIDAELQEEIMKFLPTEGASAIVMNIHSGNILAIASVPIFNPNNFSKLTNKYWKNLIDDPYKPLINKTIHSAYPPGSIFKLITILAALDYGVPQNKLINCTGDPMLGGKYFRCHAKQGHGAVDMSKAIKYSCNSYMYKIGSLIGADKIIETAEKFGFGQITGIDMPLESKGLLPNKDWKKNRYKSSWTIADTMNLSIGQGFLLASPIQIARFIAAIANKGKLLTPRVSKNAQFNAKEIDVSQDYFNILHQAMYEAVNTPGGTAYYSRILDPTRELAGKTGTAQVQSKIFSSQDFNSTAVTWEKRNHAVFVGFAPFHEPKYAISVFIDHGGGGGRVAAPVASKIMDLVLAKYI